MQYTSNAQGVPKNVFPPLYTSKWTQRTDYKYSVSDSCLAASRCRGWNVSPSVSPVNCWLTHATKQNTTRRHFRYVFMQQVPRPARQNNKRNKGSKQSFLWKQIHRQGDKLQRSKVVVTSLWRDLHWLIWRPARRLTKWKPKWKPNSKKKKKKTQKETQTRLSFLIPAPQTRRQRIKSGVEATCWDLAGMSGTPLIGSVTEGGRGTAPLAGTAAEFTK